MIAERGPGDINQATIACLIRYQIVVPVGSPGKDWAPDVLCKQDHEFLDIMVTIKTKRQEQTLSLQVNKSEWNQSGQEIYVDTDELNDEESIIIVDGFLLTKKGRLFDITVE